MLEINMLRWWSGDGGDVNTYSHGRGGKAVLYGIKLFCMLIFFYKWMWSLDHVERH